MTVARSEPTNYSFESAGDATVNIPLRIRNKNDIEVYINETIREDSTYSVASITLSDPYSFDLTFSPAPINGDQVLVIQNFPIERETDYVPGQDISASTYNIYQDDLTIMIKDLEAIIDETALKFGPEFLATITKAMQTIPAPTGTDTKALVWDGALGEWTYEINHPGGQTVDEFKSELAQATNAATSGATLVAYYNGSGSVTVQAQLDLNKSDLADLNTSLNSLLIAATAPTASGSANSPAWDTKTSAASNVQAILNEINTRLTSIEADIATLQSDVLSTTSIEVYATAALAKAAALAAPTANKIFMSEVGT